MNQKKLYLQADRALASGNYSRAKDILNDLLLLDPDNLNYLISLGESLMRNEQFSEALIPCAKAVEIDNKNIRALTNFGAALIRNKKLNDAEEILLYAVELAPKNIDLYINLSTVYQGLLLPGKALQTALKVIELDPLSYVGYNNLGCAFGDLLKIEEARESYKTARIINSSYLPTIINFAQLEVKSGNHLKAIELFEDALKIKNISTGESDLVKYYLSHSYLYTGQIEKGWEYYDFGFADLLPTGAFRSPRKFIHPKWNGDFNTNKKILIWREQGLGDEILFGTCLSDMYDTNLEIVLECDPRLVTIYQRTFPRFQVRPESINSEFYPSIIDFDLQVPFGGLPKYLRKDIHSYQKNETYFIPQADRIQFIKERLAPFNKKILVGICWRSGRLSIERNSNYTSLLDWKNLLVNKNYQFVNLLHGDCEAEISEVEKLYDIEILRWRDIDLMNDLETVLALVSELDYVVSVGTAVSVLAAAAGTRVCVLLQKSWVLLGQTEIYPWFSNVKPFVVDPGQHVGVNIDKIEPYLDSINRK
jgi:Tetratricopeptide repeat